MRGGEEIASKAFPLYDYFFVLAYNTYQNCFFCPDIIIQKKTNISDS